jgi:hypothetical protein
VASQLEAKASRLLLHVQVLPEAKQPAEFLKLVAWPPKKG